MNGMPSSAARRAAARLVADTCRSGPRKVPSRSVTISRGRVTASSSASASRPPDGEAEPRGRASPDCGDGEPDDGEGEPDCGDGTPNSVTASPTAAAVSPTAAMRRRCPAPAAAGTPGAPAGRSGSRSGRPARPAAASAATRRGSTASRRGRSVPATAAATAWPGPGGTGRSSAAGSPVRPGVPCSGTRERSTSASSRAASRRGRRRGVVGERDPGGGGHLLADLRVVVLVVHPAAAQPALALAVAAAGEHGVDVQLVDRAGEPVAGAGVGGGSLGQQHAASPGCSAASWPMKATPDGAATSRASSQKSPTLGGSVGQQRRQLRRLRAVLRRGRCAHRSSSARAGSVPAVPPLCRTPKVTRPDSPMRGPVGTDGDSPLVPVGGRRRRLHGVAHSRRAGASRYRGRRALGRQP